MDNLPQPGEMPQQPVETDNSAFSRKKSPVKKIIVIVIGVLLLAGVAYGSWWSYNNYFKEIKKEVVANNTPITITKAESLKPVGLSVTQVPLDKPTTLTKKSVNALERDKQRIQNIKKIQTALELYYVEHDKYPVAIEPIVLGKKNTKKLCNEGFVVESNICKPYHLTKTIPANPIPGGSDYLYQSQDGKSYRIDATLEFGTAKLAAGKIYTIPDKGIIQEAHIRKLVAQMPKTNSDEINNKRDLKRISDIKKIQTMLEMRYITKKSYPQVTGQVIIGSDKIKVLCDKGFQPDSSNCDEEHPGAMPINNGPGGASYRYRFISSEDYEIIFAIEKDLTPYVAGFLKASPTGIKHIEVAADLDSDNDKLSDNDEVFIWKTDPYKADTDGDSYLDGDEVANGYDPLIAGSARLEDR